MCLGLTIVVWYGILRRGFLSVTREILKMLEVNVPRRFDARGQHDFARYVGGSHARGRRLKQLFFDA